MAIDLAEFQHLDHVMDILWSRKQGGNRLTVNALDAVFERLGALGMVNGYRRILLEALDRLIDLISGILQKSSNPLHVWRGLHLEKHHLIDGAVGIIDHVIDRT